MLNIIWFLNTVEMLREERLFLLHLARHALCELQPLFHGVARIDPAGQLLTGEATSPSLEELKRRALVIHQQKKRLFVFFGTRGEPLRSLTRVRRSLNWAKSRWLRLGTSVAASGS